MTSARASVTVGIPTLDRPARLARCLDAILTGDMMPDEIIVVDQGRELPARETVRVRMDGPTTLRYLRQSRRGLSAARNLVIAQARCPIVAVTDDDCVPEPGWLAGIVSALARSPQPDAVTGRVLALPPTPDAPFAVSLRTAEHPVDYTDCTMPWLVGTGANFAIRRDLVVEVGGYDERLGAGSPGRAAEDLELSLRLLRRGARIRYEPAAVIHHECQSAARRMASRWEYGHGIGALAGMLCRRGDTYGIRILARWSSRIMRRLLRSTSTRDTSGIRQAVLSLRGTARGFLYGGCVRGSEEPRPLVDRGGIQ